MKPPPMPKSDGSLVPGRIYFGAAYYNEYQPTERLDRDLDLMASAGFSVIRVGESVWSTWEPEDGRFQLDWLAPVVEGAHRRGIGVVVGTPTYAVPPWLQRLYPGLAGERAPGQPIPWGGRQEVDFTHPAFRFHAERVIRAVVQRYAPHPAVIGFQLDNEPGLEILMNRGVFERFLDQLRHHYGDVDALNGKWGLTYWSHRLSTWADLWTPNGNTSPQYDLAWRRFQAELTTEFISWQADIVRPYLRPEQFVTTCIAYNRRALDDVSLSKALDITSGNAYFSLQDALRPNLGQDEELRDREPPAQGWSRSGAYSVFSLADRMYASRQAPFFVTETNAGSIGGPDMNYPPYPGQLRQVAWALMARGARMVEYWHWHTLHFGYETYWGGVLPHSGQPGRIYSEVAALGREIAAVGEAVASSVPDADVVMVYSRPSKWALEFMPMVPGSRPEGTHDELFGAFYRGALDSGCQVRVINDSQLAEFSPNALAREVPVLLCPALYCADDAALEFLLRYAGAGGHVVIGPRTGYTDAEARARPDIAPPLLSQAAGVFYEEFSTLTSPLPVVTPGSSPLDVDASAAGLHVVDCLNAIGAETLLSYDHGFFGRWATATTTGHGSGRLTVFGTVPNSALAKGLFAWLVPHPITGDWKRSDSVRAHSARGPGGVLVIVHNFSGIEEGVECPSAATDILSGQRLAAGASLMLGPWDVRVVSLDA
jgi:beta-galactosidase